MNASPSPASAPPRGRPRSSEADAAILDATRELLAEPRLTLTDIAFALGFSEHSAFTRAFTRWFGMSPAQYRRA